MRVLNIVLFAAVCIVIVLLAYQSDPAGTPNTAAVKDPNPMKVNAEQFARTQQNEIKYASR